MKYLSEKEFHRKMLGEKRRNKQKKMRMELRAERNRYSPLTKPETSKMIALYLFALLNAIVIYSMVAMWRFRDFTYLGVLISDIAAQVLIYAIYCLKAYKAKKSEEDLKFKREEHLGTLDNVLADGAESYDHVPLTKGNVDAVG